MNTLNSQIMICSYRYITKNFCKDVIKYVVHTACCKSHDIFARFVLRRVNWKWPIKLATVSTDYPLVYILRLSFIKHIIAYKLSLVRICQILDYLQLFAKAWTINAAYTCVLQFNT